MSGVRFGSLHSYNDLGMILKSKSIPPAEPKTSIIEVPGADGCLDLSTALTGGKIKYNNRAIVMLFVIEGRDCESKKSDIANKIQGKVFDVIFDSDPCFIYVGRCSITAYEQTRTCAELTVECNCKPYKYDALETEHNWTIETEQEVQVECGRMEVVPQITVSENMQCEFKGGIYNLNQGSNKILDVLLQEGNNTIKFIGNGNVKLRFRGGSL